MRLVSRVFLSSDFIRFFFTLFLNKYYCVLLKDSYVTEDLKFSNISFYNIVFFDILSRSNSLFLFSSKICIFFKQSRIFKTFFSSVRTKCNMLNFGYFCDLLLKGKGFYNYSFSDYVVLELGYSHRVLVPIPSGIIFKKFKYRLGFFSFDYEQLFIFIHYLLNLKKFNIYKGKGIYIKTLNFELKVGKKR